MKRKLTAACIALSAILCGCEEVQQEIIITEVIAGTVTSPEAAEETDFIPEENDGSDVSPEYVPQKSLITAAPSKENVWHMLLNSVDYYNYASGRIAYTSVDMALPVVVEFECSIPDSLAVSHYRTANVSGDISREAAESSDIDMIAGAETFLMDTSDICGREEHIIADNINMTKYVSPAFQEAVTRKQVCDIPDNERYGTEDDGTPRYILRANPTNAAMAAMCLSPQEITFGYLTNFDLWDIDGREEYAGRDCLVISGESSEDYGRQLGTENFVFYVDTETGCLLKYLGRDGEGNVVDFLISDGISFEASGDIEDRILDEMKRTVGYSVR